MSFFKTIATLATTPFTRKLRIAAVSALGALLLYLGWHARGIIDDRKNLTQQNASYAQTIKTTGDVHEIRNRNAARRNGDAWRMLVGEWSRD